MKHSMLKKFTQTNIGQGQEKDKKNSQVSEEKTNELPKIYQDDGFGKLEKPKSGLSVVTLAVILAIFASLTAVFAYEGFFRETIVMDKTGQNIIVDKQENITVTTEERIKELGESASKSVVSFYQKPTGAGSNFYEDSETLGSGVILTNDGWLMTSKGLMNKIGTDEYIILVSNAKIYEAKSVINDPGSDLVFIKIEAKDLPVTKIGEAMKLSSGQTVYGFIANYPNAKLASLHIASVTNNNQENIVESTEKMSVAVFCREGYDPSLIGAPIINLAGEVVAMINNGSEAIPAEYLRTVLDDLLKKNKIERTNLGVNYINLSSHPKINLTTGELLNKGALLSGYKNMTAIVKGSPAEKAGLKLGDIIVAIEDDMIGVEKSLGEIIQNYDPGQKIKITFIRDGQNKTVEVTLGKSD